GRGDHGHAQRDPVLPQQARRLHPRHRRVAPWWRAPGALHPPALRPRARLRGDRRPVRVPRAGGEGGGGARMTRDEFKRLLLAPEGARLEFKEARRRFDFDELVRYCVAIANEGGGHIVLGVTDGRPRRVIGTAAFPEPGRTEAGIYERVGRRVTIEEFIHEDGRVLIVHVPPRVPGSAWSDRGVHWTRAGDSLVPMTE